jgi:rSAM/selenodomain-associated transferase 2
MTVSVIIPTLNEAGAIRETIRTVRRQRPAEILIADGGSTDATLAEAQDADTVLSTLRGRATQMNAAAARARGDVLLFLHADCLLEPGALLEAESLLRHGRVAAGCFRMCVRASGVAYRTIDAVATARVRLTGIVYGDQGLFLRRNLFDRLGGFPSVGFMEDVVFSQRLCRLGHIIVGRRRIFVSPRRWQRTGVVRQTVRNWALVALAALGIPPDRLAKFYPNVR